MKQPTQAETEQLRKFLAENPIVYAQYAKVMNQAEKVLEEARDRRALDNNNVKALFH